MPHSLPSSPFPLSTFTAFFKRATFSRDGSADVVFTLAQDQAAAILDLNTNDGMALNITVHATVLDDGVDGDDGDGGLGALLDLIGGLGMGGGELGGGDDDG